jgi:hypothetical protein
MRAPLRTRGGSHHRVRVLRRAAARLLTLVVFAALGARGGHAQEIAVPIALQIELLGRVLWYERSLQRRPESALTGVILTRPNDLASTRTAGQLEAHLARAKTLGGKDITFRRIAYQSVAQTKAALIRQGSYLVYLTPGLEQVVAPLAAALEGIPILTVSPVGADVARGAVLGFELSSSKPRIALNLGRARAQKLDFSAQFLRIARVIP